MIGYLYILWIDSHKKDLFTSVTSHSYTFFFLWWELLRSTLLATFKHTVLSNFIYLLLARPGLGRSPPLVGWGRAVLRGEGTSHRGSFSRRRAQALGNTGFSSCSPWAQQLWPHCSEACGIPEAGIEPVSPALTGRFSSTEPPEKYFLRDKLNLPALQYVLGTTCRKHHLKITRKDNCYQWRAYT